MTQQDWHSEVEKVRQLRDRLDRPVDIGVVEVVAAFRMLGFQTVMSCEGHKDRFTGGPYVLFGVKTVEPLIQRWHQQDDQQIDDAKLLRDEIRRGVARSKAVLIDFLEQFYEGSDTSYGNRLMVRNLGLFNYRVEVMGIDSIVFEDDDQASIRLTAAQSELEAFKNFLKAKF